MDCSTPGFLIYHQLPELTQTHIHRVGDVIHPSHPSVISFSFCLQSFLASGSFSTSQFFTSGGQGTGASASVLQLDNMAIKHTLLANLLPFSTSSKYFNILGFPIPQNCQSAHRHLLSTGIKQQPL